jgi:hypothetical protein
LLCIKVLLVIGFSAFLGAASIDYLLLNVEDDLLFLALYAHLSYCGADRDLLDQSISKPGETRSVMCFAMGCTVIQWCVNFTPYGLG